MENNIGITKRKKLTIDYNKTEFSKEEKEQIKNEVHFIISKYPDHVPIICSSSKLKMQKNKFLVNKNLTFSEFIGSVRKKIEKLNAEDGLFFLVDNIMIPMTMDIGTVYHQNKDPNTNILQIWIMKENMFG